MIIRDSNNNELVDIFIADLKTNEIDIFKPTYIVVPNMSYANWLSDKIVLQNGIIANINFMVLNQFINNYYLYLHPHTVQPNSGAVAYKADKIHGFHKASSNANVKFLELSSIKYIIYDFLHNCNLNDDEFDPIRSYLLTDNINIDSFRAFKLASMLEFIFVDYLYLRTEELIFNNEFRSKLPQYQQLIWQEIFELDKKTFLDVYSFFNSNKDFRLDSNIYIFGVTTIFPSQLQIIKNIANCCNLRWYIPTITLEYYYDLLDNRTQEKLKRKILKEPEISVNDLHLTEGNPLLANMALQSREFNELIIANDIETYDIDTTNKPPITLLELVQDDIRKINHRIDKNLRLSNDNAYYVDPIILSDSYDNTIKINVCHNRMREVQVLFNSVCEILDNNQDITFSDILIVAPDINEYDTYIQAVFSNEYTNYRDNKAKIPFNVCGFKTNHDVQLFNSILSILKIEYQLKISSIFGLLNQTKIMEALGLNNDDVELLRVWFKENNIHFGLDADDYSVYGYDKIELFSLKQLLNNVVLGACIPQELLVEASNNSLLNIGCAYDNIEYSQIGLCNKLIKFIDFLGNTRKLFYENEYTYKKFDKLQVVEFFRGMKDYFILDELDQLTMDEIIAKFNSLDVKTQINLPIIIEIIVDHFKKADERIVATGKLTFTSMKSAKNIPYKVIYVMGMNYGDFPQIQNTNKLSILYDSAVFADRNANISDKQLFIDTIIAAEKLLYFSYIGRDDSDNRELEPSVALQLLIKVLKNSIANPNYVDQHIIKVHSLHPFNDYIERNYSSFWCGINASDQVDNLHWNFKKPNDINKEKLSNNLSIFTNHGANKQTKASNIENNHIDIAKLTSSFYYSNTNLYDTLGIKNYNLTDELVDYEPLAMVGRGLQKQLYNKLLQLKSMQKTKSNDKELIYNRLYNSGLLAYNHIGRYQFEQLYDNYTKYQELKGDIPVLINYHNEKYNIIIEDKIFANSKGEIVILNDFVYMTDKAFNDVSYRLKIKGIIYLLLLQLGEISVSPQSSVEIIKDKVFIKVGLNDEQATYAMCIENKSDLSNILNNILEFYTKSFISPTCIVEELINTLLKKDKPLSTSSDLKSMLSMSSYNKIDQDPLFYNNVDDYFNHTALVDNSNIQIANILSYFRIQSVSPAV